MARERAVSFSGVMRFGLLVFFSWVTPRKEGISIVHFTQSVWVFIHDGWGHIDAVVSFVSAGSEVGDSSCLLLAYNVCEFVYYSLWSLVIITETAFYGLCQGCLVTSILHLLFGRFGAILFHAATYNPQIKGAMFCSLPTICQAISARAG